MQTYECVTILNPNLTDEELQKARERIEGTITSNEGKIIKQDDWGIRRLAYELNKNKKGRYLFWIFTSPTTMVKTLETLFKVYDPVFKHMFVRLEKAQLQALQAEMTGKKEEPQAGE